MFFELVNLPSRSHQKQTKHICGSLRWFFPLCLRRMDRKQSNSWRFLKLWNLPLAEAQCRSQIERWVAPCWKCLESVAEHSNLLHMHFIVLNVKKQLHTLYCHWLNGMMGKKWNPIVILCHNPPGVWTGKFWILTHSISTSQWPQKVHCGTQDQDLTVMLDPGPICCPSLNQCVKRLLFGVKQMLPLPALWCFWAARFWEGMTC